MYDSFLFDLDGTLTESAPGITRSVSHALAKRGISADPEDLTVFIGPPLKDSFERYYNLQDAAHAIQDYREYYEKQGMFENSVYAGVEDALSALQKAGKKLYVCTSKPEKYARQILEYFGLLQYFHGVYGASMDEKLVEKSDIIALCLQENHPAAPVMIGDREHDIFGARSNGIDSIGVLYGYGSKEELEQAGADHLIETPEQLLLYA